MLDFSPLPKALLTLASAMAETATRPGDLLARDGCIQRFEYSYELCVKEGTEDSAAGTELLIYERYVTKADLEVTHNASAPFKAFGKWLNEESGIVLAKSKAWCVCLGVL